jgi:hypothetical protein
MSYSNTKTKKYSVHRESGTATVEVAIMLPLYVFLLTTLIYFGTFHRLNLDVLKATILVSQTPEQQESEDALIDLGLRALEQDGIAGFPSKIRDLVIKDNTSSDLFAKDDILAMFNENTYRITGGYELEGQNMVYTTSESPTPWTKTIEKYDLSSLDQKIEDEASY